MIQWHVLLEQLNQAGAEREDLAETFASSAAPGTEKSAEPEQPSGAKLKTLQAKLGNQAVAKLMAKSAAPDAQMDKVELDAIAKSSDNDKSEKQSAGDKKTAKEQPFATVEQALDHASELGSKLHFEIKPDTKKSDNNKPEPQKGRADSAVGPTSIKTNHWKKALSIVAMTPLETSKVVWDTLEKHYLSARPPTQQAMLSKLLPTLTPLDEKQRSHMLKQWNSKGLMRLHLIQALVKRLLADAPQLPLVESEPTPDED